MKKLLLAGLMAATAALAFAAPSQAHHKWHKNHWYGPSFGLIVDADPYYYNDDYVDSCYVKKVKKFDKWGNKIIKKVTICN